MIARNVPRLIIHISPWRSIPATSSMHVGTDDAYCAGRTIERGNSRSSFSKTDSTLIGQSIDKRPRCGILICTRCRQAASKDAPASCESQERPRRPATPRPFAFSIPGGHAMDERFKKLWERIDALHDKVAKEPATGA